MSLFRSRRERSFWLWTLVVLLAIYLTSGVVPMMAGFIRDQNMQATVLLIGMALVAGSIFARRITIRPGWSELGVMLGVAAAYLLVILRVNIPEERSHLIEYSIVACFIYEALYERARSGGRVPVPAVLALVSTALLGFIDECIQYLLPNRVFDWMDVAFNALAALMAVSACVSIDWVQRIRKALAERKAKKVDSPPKDY